MLLLSCAACNKVVEVELPGYDSELVVEMYLQDGDFLKCLVSESVPYTSNAIEKSPVRSVVIFSDGVTNDTLRQERIEDWEAARWYNYASPKLFFADSAKTYTLTVSDGGTRKVTASTRLTQRMVRIDSLVCRPGEDNKNMFSIGMVIKDPPAPGDYYRFLITRRMNDYSPEVTDFYAADVSFNGEVYSFFSDAVYNRNDTVLARVYSLPAAHYDFLQTANNARRANFNPFVQPSPLQSNVTGGLGIFTILRYDERRIVVR